MPSRPAIYVSVSDDGVRSYVQGVGARLLPTVCEFCFVDEPGSCRAEAAEAMRARMAACDAVVHLVGEVFGPEPEDAGEGGARRSFAQMEYDLALELAKPLHLVLLGGELVGASDEPEALQRLQEQHRAAVVAGAHPVETIGSGPALRAYLWSLAERLRAAGKTEPSAETVSGYAPPPPAMPAAELLPAAVPPKPPSPPENVVFTAYRPGTVRPGHWEKLLFFAHLDEKPAWMDEDERAPIEEVEAQAAGVLGRKLDQYSRHSGDSRFPVPRDGEITLTPEMAGVEFDPPRRAFFWREGVAVHGETFRLRASAALDGQIARGRLTVFLGALILAEIGLAVRVGGSPGAVTGTRRTSAAPFRKIFASYSHRDVEVVETLERHARTLGDEYLRDWVDLRSGERWNERLLAMVEEADVFQLFWSRHAADSPYVEREWRHALSLGREAFVRPTYWERPMPPAPPDLARLHFHRLTADVPRPPGPTTLSAAEPVAAPNPCPSPPAASGPVPPPPAPYAFRPEPSAVPPPAAPAAVPYGTFPFDGYAPLPPAARSSGRLKRWLVWTLFLAALAAGYGFWLARH